MKRKVRGKRKRSESPESPVETGAELVESSAVGTDGANKGGAECPPPKFALAIRPPGDLERLRRSDCVRIELAAKHNWKVKRRLRKKILAALESTLDSPATRGRLVCSIARAVIAINAQDIDLARARAPHPQPGPQTAVQVNVQGVPAAGNLTADQLDRLADLDDTLSSDVGA